MEGGGRAEQEQKQEDQPAADAAHPVTWRYSIARLTDLEASRSGGSGRRRRRSVRSDEEISSEGKRALSLSLSPLYLTDDRAQRERRGRVDVWGGQ